MTLSTSLSRLRLTLGGLLRVTLVLASVIIFMWLDAFEIIPFGFIGRSDEIVTPLFLALHGLLLLSIVTAIWAFRTRGLWSLFGLIALLPGPLWVAALFYACAAEGQCV